MYQKSKSKNNFLPYIISFAIMACGLIIPGAAYGGPPFVTDDPEPVDYRHWEFYLGTQLNYSRGSITGTAALVEINYGVIPDVQLHVIAPASYAISRGKYADLRVLPPIPYASNKWNKVVIGYGDTEIGMKARFIHESAALPQLGIFPMIEVPSGARSLGYDGLPHVYFPLYVQKSWDRLTTYGGGGFWYNPGKDNKNFWFAGWLLQYKITGTFTLGGELFYNSPDSKGSDHRVSANVGMILDITENWHILFSVGRDINGPAIVFSYLAIQAAI